MERKSFGNMQCPVARSLEHVGEWWSILILRDAFHGLSRFDEFQKSLDIAPNILTRRLNALVEGGLLERRQYNDRPPRYEYLLTERGRDFRPVLLTLLAWGNKHFAPEGLSVAVVDAETGEPADPVVVDRCSGRPIQPPDFIYIPGPAAGDAVRRKLEFSAQQRERAARGPDPSHAPDTSDAIEGATHE
jgi:DNA-binding HxlR family transcriptional regulator